MSEPAKLFCLKCDKLFNSIDRKKNRLCWTCKTTTRGIGIGFPAIDGFHLTDKETKKMNKAYKKYINPSKDPCFSPSRKMKRKQILDAMEISTIDAIVHSKIDAMLYSKIDK